MSSDRLDIDVTDNVKAVVTPLIEEKLSELLQDEDKDSLVQYILLLVGNNRTKEHIREDLESFFGSEQASSFTEWLWDTLHGMDFSSPPSAMNAENATETGKRKRPSQPHGANRLFKSAITATRDESGRRRAKPTASRSASKPAKKRRVVVKKQEKTMRADGEEVRSGGLLVSADLTEPEPPEKASPVVESKGMDVDDDTNYTAVLPPPKPRIVVKSSNASLERKLAALAAELQATRAAAVAGGGRRGRVAKPPPRGAVRCSYWPSCTRRGCTFYHPSMPCRWFPKCKNGDKCLYKHPICKWKAKCTNAKCTYAHPSFRKVATVPTAAGEGKEGEGKEGEAKAAGQQQQAKRKVVVCRYDLKCNKISCTFAHPMREAEEARLFGDDKSKQDTEALSSTLPGTPPHMHD